MEYNKVAITGDLGSGKSVTSHYIAEKLNAQYISTGHLQRTMAAHMGITVLEMNRMAEINPEIDRKIDGVLKELKNESCSYVLDSRLAWHFIPNSLKVYLRTNLEITVNRIFADTKRSSEKYKDRDTAKSEILQRKASENKRFKREYGVDCDDFNNYDMVVETTSASPADIGDRIIAHARSNSPITSGHKFWVSPKFLFPLQSVRGFGDGRTHSITQYFNSEVQFKEYMVICLFFEGYYYIYDGHKRVSAALRNKIPLIPVVIFDAQRKLPFEESVADFLKQAFLKRNVYDWEDMHDFSFEVYPPLNTTKH